MSSEARKISQQFEVRGTEWSDDMLEILNIRQGGYIGDAGPVESDRFERHAPQGGEVCQAHHVREPQPLHRHPGKEPEIRDLRSLEAKSLQAHPPQRFEVGDFREIEFQALERHPLEGAGVLHRSGTLKQEHLQSLL